MKQEVKSEQRVDGNGNPAGGTARGTGIVIDWQNGPLKHTDPSGLVVERKPTGAFVEGVIQAVLDRMQFYQQTQFACLENEAAIECLEEALSHLNSRTARREAAGIEGTHQEDTPSTEERDFTLPSI